MSIHLKLVLCILKTSVREANLILQSCWTMLGVVEQQCWVLLDNNVGGCWTTMLGVVGQQCWVIYTLNSDKPEIETLACFHILVVLLSLTIQAIRGW